MAKRKKIDPKKLIKVVSDGEDQKDIMDTFGFSSATQLKLAYTNALIQTGAVPAIQSGRGAKAENAVSRQVTVGKRGSIIVPKALVDELGFQEGDRFLAKKTKAGISLSRKY